MNRSPTALDKQIGRRMRHARLAMGMTQTDLAHQSGIKFQQIQKYETGVNRVAASRLSLIATNLGVNLAYFFDEDTEQKGDLMSKEEAKYLTTLRKLTPEQRASALNLLKAMVP